MSFHDWGEFTFNNRDPVYLQVVRHFKLLIVTARIEAGQAIPSRRELASLLKINPNTAQRAYKEMEDQRLIVTEGNSPSRVTANAEVLRGIRDELLGEAVREFVASVRPIGVSVEELVERMRASFSDAERRSALNGEGEGGERA